MNLKAIENYEGLYSIDLNNNQVWGHKRQQYLKPTIGEKNTRNNYYRVGLCKNGITKNFKIHRLVYSAYYGKIEDNIQIDHIDGNKQNNNIENLRKSTQSQNQMNSLVYKNNRVGYKNITLTVNNTYQVRIKKDKKVVYNKNFKNLEEAINMRNIKLKEIHKEFANY